VPFILLDTHAFLWWCEASSDLSKKAIRAIAQADCYVSLVSLWEIAIKASLGKLKLPASFERYIPEQLQLNGFSQMEIGFRHIAGCAALPWHHRDPFDRLLAAQAIEEGLSVVSRDPIFERYGIQRIW
jgi:PIN domain nuclease of toxin-antitoxin system